MKDPAGRRSMPLLVIADLRVRIATARGVLRAVDGVSFDLPPGRTLALVGESGCGKSMLCRAVAGLLPPAAQVAPGSRVRFGGRDLTTLPEGTLTRIRGREIAMVLQNPMSSLNPVVKIGRQVAEGLIVHLGMTRRAARERAVAILRSVGIPAPAIRAGQYPHQLSGGMRQRAALAMALACDPALLIADEPTTSLDVTVQAEILDLLARFQGERGMAVLLVTHDLAVAAERAHTIAVMYAGRIVETAPAERIFAQSRMPYTRALAESRPRFADPPHRRFRAIDGQPPDLADPPGGCRFAPRCGSARGRCHTEAPPLRPAASFGHAYACWYPLEDR